MKGEQNRQRVVSTALRLFHERGYASTSLADVAERSGLLKETWLTTSRQSRTC